MVPPRTLLYNNIYIKKKKDELKNFIPNYEKGNKKIFQKYKTNV